MGNCLRVGAHGQHVRASGMNFNPIIKTPLATLAHELKHAYQFQTGLLALDFKGKGGSTLYDAKDEVEAYLRGQLINPSGYHYGKTIDVDFVLGIVNSLGEKPYEGLSKVQLTLSSSYPGVPNETYKDQLIRATGIWGKQNVNPKVIFINWKTYYNAE